MEGNGGKDELDVVAVAKSGTKEACAKTPQTVAPLGDGLGQCGFTCPCQPVKP